MRRVVLAALVVGSPIAARAAEPWELVLKDQLQRQYKCELARVVSAREVEVGGRRTFEGRVLCRDGREVDFSRASTHTRFELKLCQPVVC